MKASDVARYLLAKSALFGDVTTNKKLQKLLYYVKAWGLVYFADGVIDDQFEAWVHGPVCRSVYNYYREFRYSPITDTFDNKSPEQFITDFSRFQNSDKIELIDTVYEKYSPLSSMELELLSHTERPWIEARGNLSPVENGNSIISEATMKSFYSQKIS